MKIILYTINQSIYDQLENNSVPTVTVGGQWEYFATLFDMNRERGLNELGSVLVFRRKVVIISCFLQNIYFRLLNCER